MHLERATLHTVWRQQQQHIRAHPGEAAHALEPVHDVRRVGGALVQVLGAGLGAPVAAKRQRWLLRHAAVALHAGCCVAESRVSASAWRGQGLPVP